MIVKRWIAGSLSAIFIKA